MGKALILIALIGFAVPVVAEDEMELQRCIWRCLADSKSNTDPAYDSCVEQRCNDSSSESINEKENKADTAVGQKAFSTAYNENGAIIRFAKDGHTVYLGKDCDTFSSDLGKGRWGIKGKKVVITVGKSQFNFPKKEIKLRECRL